MALVHSAGHAFANPVHVGEEDAAVHEGQGLLVQCAVTAVRFTDVDVVEGQGAKLSHTRV